MVTDWIKMRTDLYRDPKVCVMADHLGEPDGQLAAYVCQHNQCDMSVTRNVMRNVVVGALVTVWGVMRHRGKRRDDDLVMRGVTLAVVDDIADLPGFGAAMLAVGWVQESAAGIVFPHFFEEFNHEPGSDARQKNAERQRRYREKRNVTRDVTRDVTVTSQSNTEKRREEKSREEKEEPPIPPADAGESAPEKASKKKKAAKPSGDAVPIPEPLDTAEFRAAWAEWLADRRERKKTLTERAAKTQLADLTPFGPVWAIARIRKAIVSRWTGLVFADDEPPRPRLHEPAPVKGWVDFPNQPPRSEVS